MVEAVPKKVHAPTEGQPVNLYSRISSFVISFFLFSLKDISPATREVVMSGPGLMLPPGRKTVGISILAAAFKWAGTDLSQELERTIPSQGTAPA